VFDDHGGGGRGPLEDGRWSYRFSGDRRGERPEGWKQGRERRKEERSSY
jgi:hypothetical protein